MSHLCEMNGKYNIPKIPNSINKITYYGSHLGLSKLRGTPFCYIHSKKERHLLILIEIINSILSSVYV